MAVILPGSTPLLNDSPLIMMYDKKDVILACQL